MRFTVKDSEFRIRFVHTPDLSSLRLARVTTCLIDFRDGDRWVPTGLGGSARCSPKDQFVKEKGRKLSLARAMLGSDPVSRREAWKAYLGRAR